ncbi:hypothetical protein [Tsukamurella tyrosinosolvens]|uniref:hypothetical protein n=1 Tax=Tsukamurella tyrosinosolvens TaxID=57704 RepID=UPI002DD42731|nr:hypothetical protein [Tsukamurella tyrosinosolvens]MEC4614572.1 hypothetical protein [Tsukamurella tyrosinosolvens]
MSNQKITVEPTSGGKGIRIQTTTSTGAQPYINVSYHTAYFLAEQLINLIQAHRDRQKEHQ